MSSESYSPLDVSSDATPQTESLNEDGEDYAMRRVPEHFRKTPFNIGMGLSGVVWSVFNIALGGSMALAFGVPTALLALAVAAVLGAILGGFIARLTAANGLAVDLLSRGLGYGFLGSAFSALVFAITYLLYCGLEAAFIATAVHTFLPGVPLWVLAIATAVIMIPLNWYGFRLNLWLQRITWPLFLVGLVALMIANFGSGTASDALLTAPITMPNLLGAIATALPVLSILALTVGDWSRFARRKDMRRVQVVSSSVVLGGVFVIAAPLGAFLAVFTVEANPGVYAVTSLGVWGLIWVVVTQLRVQNINYYGASLALANFFVRVFRFAPGRQFWVVVTAAVTAVAVLTNILDHLIIVLTFCGCVLLAWLGTLLAGILVGPAILKIDLLQIEYRRGYLQNWGWPALAGLAIGSVFGGWLTLAGIPDAALGSFFGQVAALLLGFVAYVLTALFLRRRWSLTARPTAIEWEDAADALVVKGEKVATCVACEGVFVRSDMIPCPVDPSSAAVCSVCAAQDKSCHPEHHGLLYPSV